MIRPLKTRQEIKDCVEMYAARNDWVEVDTAYSEATLLSLVKRKKFVRGLFKEDKVRAWILADITTHMYHPRQIFQQLFYCSDLTGVASARAVIELHKAMEEEGIIKGVDLLMSTGSHEDEKFVFTRLLERAGWERRGHVALLRL